MAKEINHEEAVRRLGLDRLAPGTSSFQGDANPTTEGVILNAAGKQVGLVERVDDSHWKADYRGRTVHARKDGVMWIMFYDPIPKKWANTFGTVTSYSSAEDAIEAGIRSIDALLEEELANPQ